AGPGFFTPNIGYSPRLDALGEWNEIWRAHQRYLERALSPGVAPDHRSIARHESDVVEYLDAIIPHSARALIAGDKTGSPLLPFDPQVIDDERARNLALIVQRRGQSEFREALLRAYDSACCFSGCAVEQVLEAAHIVPYQGPATNHVRNGLLLRTDLHTLFDLGLITIDAATMTIIVDPALAGSIYAEFDGRTIRRPRDPNDRPAEGFLEYHRQRSNEAMQRTRLSAGR
ncbi:MAG: HNH endonuclease, partial [Isosphaeraceae bacterium]